jgi:hypothetical protein
MATEKPEKDEVTYEIVEHIGLLAQNPSGWTKELNLVSWNQAAPKSDIRDWDSTHEHMSRGVTLRPEEAKKLVELLSEQSFE